MHPPSGLVFFHNPPSRAPSCDETRAGAAHAIADCGLRHHRRRHGGISAETRERGLDAYLAHAGVPRQSHE